LYLGPSNEGQFYKAEVTRLEWNRQVVNSVKAGQICTIQINFGNAAQKWINEQGGEIRKGMVLVSTKQDPKATMTFTALLTQISDPQKSQQSTSKKQTVKMSYQPVVHI